MRPESPKNWSPEREPDTFIVGERALARARKVARKITERVRATRKAGGNPRWAEGVPTLAERPLGQLRRSAEVLVRGEEGHAADEPEEP